MVSTREGLRLLRLNQEPLALAVIYTTEFYTVH